MNRVLGLFASVVALGFTGGAQALPITDIFTPDPSVTLTTGTPYEYQHSLIAHGFDPLVHTLTSATLVLSISGAGGQGLTVTFDGIKVFDSSLNALVSEQPLEVLLSYLQTDGLLNVVLTKDGGLGSTFTFTMSTLHADGSVSEPAEVPEPAVLGLLAIGLLGLGLVAQRRRRAL